MPVSASRPPKSEDTLQLLRYLVAANLRHFPSTDRQPWGPEEPEQELWRLQMVDSVRSQGGLIWLREDMATPEGGPESAGRPDSTGHRGVI